MNCLKAKHSPFKSKFRLCRRLAPLVLAAAFASSPGQARASEEAEPEDIHIPSHKPSAEDAGYKTEIDGYAQLAKEASDKEKWPLADHFLHLLVELPCPDTDKKAALKEIAEGYEKHHQLTKTLAIYEKMIELFPLDSELPHFFFKAGQLYRDTGAYGRAVSRYYSVLNTALKINERGADSYRELSERAQTEIAETYLLMGDYKQASKFYQLLSRGELSEEQRARVQFKAMHCQFLLEDSAGAVASAEKFLSAYPDDLSVPEVRFIQASALRSLGRKKEAFDTVLELLRAEKVRREKAPDRWAYWQKKTGNEFANEFYKQGDFLSALTIYQTLAKLGEEPDWQWPVIYQMGLCFERLRLTSRAGEAYKYIIDQQKKTESEGVTLSENLGNLAQMAQWRGEQLAWQYSTEATLQHLLGEPQSLPATGSSTLKSASAKPAKRP